MEGIQKRSTNSLGSIYLLNFDKPWSKGDLLFINCSRLNHTIPTFQRISSIHEGNVDIISRWEIAKFFQGKVRNEFLYNTQSLTESSFAEQDWDKFRNNYSSIIIVTNENPRDSIHFLSYFNVWKLFNSCPEKTFFINRCYCVYEYYPFMGITEPLTIDGLKHYLYFMVSEKARQVFVDKVSEASKNGEVLEIGRAFGGSATAMALASSKYNKKIYSVDIKDDSLLDEFTSFYHVKSKITRLNMGSYNTFLYWKNNFGRNLSFVFIDGDHAEEAIARDIRTWSELLIPGGTICLHEYAHNDINQSTRVIFEEIISKEDIFSDFEQVEDLFFAKVKKKNNATDSLKHKSYFSSSKFDERLRIYLTLKCNLKCPYCVNEQKSLRASQSSDYLLRPANEWAQAINKIGKDVVFTGGEPTLYPELYQLLNSIDTNIDIQIYTNLKFDVKDFGNNIKRKISFYVSYHPSYGDRKKFIEDYKKLSGHGSFNCFLHAVNVGNKSESMNRIKDDFVKSGIDIVLDNDQLHGFEGSSQAFKIKANCSRTIILIAPDGTRYPCLSKMLRQTGALENIIDNAIDDEKFSLVCDDYGYCAPCDCLGETKIEPIM